MTTKRYFEDCQTMEQAKKLYKTLAKVHHPDMQGPSACVKAMQDINNQFEAFRPTEGTATSAQDNKNFADFINQLIVIEGLEIEVCGSWVWIGGSTYAKRTEIKAINYGEAYRLGFSKNKSMWYVSPVEYRKKSGKSLDIDNIRHLYGSEKITSTQRPILS